MDLGSKYKRMYCIKDYDTINNFIGQPTILEKDVNECFINETKYKLNLLILNV